MNLISFHFFVIYFCVFDVYCRSPVVKIPQGKLRGRIRRNRDFGRYYSFQNIPFGKPPIGKLRFKAPQPADSWKGTRNATKDIPECVQQSLGQEDCLYLNVFTTGLPKQNVTKLPVMVFIHGRFYRGISKSIIYGGRFLLTKEVVLVTFNYRLGIFGFLSLDDANLGIPGNAALKDQVLVLKWVRDNIQYFGGDSNNVMIFGEGFGATSVQLLMLSPMANGLFHKAICQSGSALWEHLVPRSRNNTIAVAEYLNITTENRTEMLLALQDVPTSDVIDADQSLMEDFYPLFSGPTIEIASNEPSFLDKKPIDIMKSGSYNQVPFIIGINNAEGLILQAESSVLEATNLIIDDFIRHAPSEFNITKGSELEKEINTTIKQFYFGDTEPNKDNITQVIDLITDYFFGYPSYRSVEEHIKTAKNPIYFYHFTAKTNLNIMGKLDETIEYPGAAHGDELGYIFRNVLPLVVRSESIEDRGIINMVNLWTNFAIHGDPTPKNSSDYIWEPVTKNQFKYLHIGTEKSYLIESLFTPQRMIFWSSLYKQYT